MVSIYPLILCGGMGSRLWPMSRIDQPKQFQPTDGPDSLTYFQTTVQRHRGALFHDPIIVTNAAQAGLVTQQLSEIQVSGRIIGEPVGRNTGPAVLAAALSILQDDPDAVLLVLPSDHIIVGDLNTTVGTMRAAAAKGQIIVFGIAPLYAETGYGYIIDGGAVAGHDGLHSVARFIEKPPVDVAEDLIHQGTAYWASGISMFRADVISAEFQRLDPQTHAAVSGSVTAAKKTRTGITLNEPEFRQARDEPTERAIFEKTPAIALAMLDVKWDDVGAWSSVYDVNTKCTDGNVTNGDVMTLDTTNSLIRSDGRLVVVIGMDDLILVDTTDALLVTNRKHAQHVKTVVEKLKSGSRAEVVSHPFRKQVWGVIEALATEPGYRLDMILLRPGSTMEINGHGLGSSFLSVVSGQGSYTDERTEEPRDLALGSMLTIDRDTEVSLTNTAKGDMRAFLLSTTTETTQDSFETEEVAPLRRALAHG